MMAAISAARQGAENIRLIEKNQFLGRKLLATGNGRCNLTNINCHEAEETLRFFAEMGLLTRMEEEGRIYPYSEQASAVQEALVSEMNHSKVEILCGMEVQAIESNDSGFRIVCGKKEEWHADALILATGGKAGPQYGSTGDGYRFARAFGHTVIRPMPSLVQLISEQSFFPALKGVRAKGQTELLRKEECVGRETGEIQFTGDGLSGICIFNLSRKFMPGDMVKIDLFPQYSEEALENFLISRVETLRTRRLSEFLNGMIHKKLSPVLLHEISLEANRQAESLSREEILKIVRVLKEWRISIIGTKGWKEAQVTSGGVDLAEVDKSTMESRRMRKLYFAGELLNVDERCGGYNLQWAWTSGFIAGKSAAVALREKSC